ncbi:hypothetical protein SAMN02745866_02145 [Alteromonadaceae bacterium Bs31]|nr:hypothetical protein SAMN02745866_02145 [Alteromonadaceae bacterium Bs31]
MAHSYIEYKDKNCRVHDLDLSMACFLIMKKANGSGKFEKLFDEWMDSISFDGPGCVDLHLTDYLIDIEDVRDFQNLLGLAEQDLKTFSGLYPKSELGEYLGKAKINLVEDYKAELIEEALQRLRSIVD